MGADCNLCDQDLLQTLEGEFFCPSCVLRAEREKLESRVGVLEAELKDKDKDYNELRGRVCTLEKENAILRKIHGIKLKKSTIKQSLVLVNERIRELESALDAEKNRYNDPS